MESTRERFVVVVGGESVDLTDFPPLTQGDMKALRKEPYELNMRSMKDPSPDEEARFALFCLRKKRTQTTLEEVDALKARTVQEIGGHCLRRGFELDLPFSNPSTSSQANTAGARESSIDEPPQS